MLVDYFGKQGANSESLGAPSNLWGVSKAGGLVAALICRQRIGGPPRCGYSPYEVGAAPGYSVARTARGRAENNAPGVIRRRSVETADNRVAVIRPTKMGATPGYSLPAP
ncbi:hypothetical protein ACPA9J_32735 [Pseudomonas aeruginosa]